MRAVVCDVMLGRLARWLRVLGVDTLYRRDWRDAELCGVAHRERRILLTRDARLAASRGAPPHLLLTENDLFGQLVHVCLALRIRPCARCFTRCTACNGVLSERSAESVAERLFPHVRATQRHVWLCQGCGKIYWGGTHPERIRSLLERLERALE
jgi:uncharacterized protein with PIN domain